MKKEKEPINQKIDDLIQALQERLDKYDKMSQKIRKEVEFKAIYKIMLHHSCSINMLKGIKELIGLED